MSSGNPEGEGSLHGDDGDDNQNEDNKTSSGTHRQSTATEEANYTYDELIRVVITRKRAVLMAIEEVKLQFAMNKQWPSLKFFSDMLDGEWIALEDLVMDNGALVKPNPDAPAPYDLIHQELRPIYMKWKAELSRIENDYAEYLEEKRAQRAARKRKEEELAAQARKDTEEQKLVDSLANLNIRLSEDEEEGDTTSLGFRTGAIPKTSSSVPTTSAFFNPTPTVFSAASNEQTATSQAEATASGLFGLQSSGPWSAPNTAATDTFGLSSKVSDVESRMKGLENLLSTLLEENERLRLVGENVADSMERQASNVRREPPVDPAPGGSAPTLGARTSTTTTSLPIPSTYSATRLPPIELPHFDGKREDWLYFKGVVEEHVCANAALSDLDKMITVKGLLHGDAQRVVHAYLPIASNWTPFWKSLCERFNEDCTDSNDDVRAIMSLPQIQVKWSREQIQAWLDDFRAHFRSLGISGHKPDYKSIVWKVILLKKLDRELTKEIKFQQKDGDLNSILDFIELKKRSANRYKTKEGEEPPATLAAFASVAKQKNADAKKKKEDSKKSAKQAKTDGSASSSASSSTDGSQDKKKNKKKPQPDQVCFVCQKAGDHFWFKCKDFIKLTPVERVKKCIECKRCLLCCEEKHDGPCERNFFCRAKCKDPATHHYLLHDPAVHTP